MNIAFFGSSLVSAYWNGAATYYRGIIRALQRAGASSSRFMSRTRMSGSSTVTWTIPNWARVVVYAGEGRGWA